MYTKGKWEVANSGGTVILGGMSHPKTIATLETVPLKISPEVEANAKLIAAAPELLDLLKDILEWDGILPHSKTRIKRTIAKAEGKL